MLMTTILLKGFWFIYLEEQKRFVIVCSVNVDYKYRFSKLKVKMMQTKFELLQFFIQL